MHNSLFYNLILTIFKQDSLQLIVEYDKCFGRMIFLSIHQFILDSSIRSPFLCPFACILLIAGMVKLPTDY